MSEFMDALRKTANAAVAAGKPMSYIFGEVTAVDPELKIRISQDIELSERNLILTDAVKDITYSIKRHTYETEEAAMHSHTVTTEDTITIYKSLKIGERVLMLSAPGEQRFIVLSRGGGKVYDASGVKS